MQSSGFADPPPPRPTVGVTQRKWTSQHTTRCVHPPPPALAQTHAEKQEDDGQTTRCIERACVEARRHPRRGPHAASTTRRIEQAQTLYWTSG